MHHIAQLRFKSYASRNQLAVYQSNVEAGVRLEWDRRYVTVLGVANKRLYEFRLQTDNVQYEKAQVSPRIAWQLPMWYHCSC